MRITGEYIKKNIGGRVVVMPTVGKEVDTMINLNETGAFLWDILVSKDVTIDELVDAMMEEYAASREDIQKGVEAFVNKVKEAGLIK